MKISKWQPFFILIILGFWFLTPMAYAEEARPKSTKRTIAKWTYLSAPVLWGYVDVRHTLVTKSACGFSPLRCTGYHEAMVDSAQFASSTAYMLDDLVKLSKDQEALRVLKKINSMASDEEHRFNLWTVTLREFDGNKRKTMQFLAAFFQDRDLNADLPINPNTNKLMHDTFKKIVKGMDKNIIQGYPPGIPSNKAGIYHFYVIGEIAAKMRDKGVPTQCAATMPYIINEAYEIPLNSHAKGVFDIYTGYAGASFALSNDQKGFSGVHYDTFKQKYNSDGASAIGNYFKDDLGENAYCKNKPNSGPPKSSRIQTQPDNNENRPDPVRDLLLEIDGVQ